MKTMAGVFLRATLNRSRMRAAATPSNISTNSEPLAEKNATSEDPAMALARYVFPVPGGPSSRIPCPQRRQVRSLSQHAQRWVQCFGGDGDISIWAQQSWLHFWLILCKVAASEECVEAC